MGFFDLLQYQPPPRLVSPYDKKLLGRRYDSRADPRFTPSNLIRF